VKKEAILATIDTGFEACFLLPREIWKEFSDSGILYRGRLLSYIYRE